MQRIAIVDPSDLTREPLRNLLLGVDSIWIEAECARYEFFPDIVEQSKPEVVVIALDSDPNKAVALVKQLHQEHPALPILAISGKGDGQLILQALRAGAKEFLTQPVVLEELLKALERLIEHDGSENGVAKAGSMVLAIIGSRGGVGCTSIAVNVGCSLAQDSNHNVALIDLDLALGDADVALDVVPDHTLVDIAQNIERLDMQFLRRTLCKHATGLALLPHPVRLEELNMVHEEHLQRTINLLRATYSHLIFDLSKSFTVMDLTALHAANEILLVTQLELSSLRNAVRILMTMGTEEGLSERIKVVVNRVGSDYSEGDISLKKAEEILGKPVYWQVPNDAKAMMSSRNAGVPLIQHAPKSKVHQSIAALGSALCGTNGNGKPETKATSNGFWPWKR
jgi:pilus assembly protein CpaE